MSRVASRELWQFLKALGAPDHCIEFKLVVKVDSVVTAEALYHPTMDLGKDGKLATATKRYRLVEVDEDDELP